MLKNKTVIAVFINCLLMTINAGIMLYKGQIDYLLMIIVCSYYKVLPIIIFIINSKFEICLSCYC